MNVKKVKKNKQLKEMNKTIQDLKIEIEAIKKTQTEGILEKENLFKKTGTKMQALLTECKTWKRESQASKK